MRRTLPALVCLLLAWFCANRPVELCVGLGGWLRGALQFSHQEQLAAQLRMTLARAQAAPPPVAVAAQSRERSEPSPLAPAPAAESVLGKIPFALVGGLEVLPPDARRQGWAVAQSCRDARARDVPVPVPRGGGRVVL